MKWISTSLVVILFSACRNDIVRPADYQSAFESGLHEQRRKASADDIIFWSRKLADDTSGYINKFQLGLQYLKSFRLHGVARDLFLGDSLMRAASLKLRDSDPELLYPLSQNAISRHRFNDARRFALMAGKAGGDTRVAELLQFDAGFELGKYAEAGKLLLSIQERTGFDYLIRKAKLEDQGGNSERSIMLMEKAFELVREKNIPLHCWAASNLADMYGHAGRIDEAYRLYVDVLKKDPAYLYALKGIAWIAYAHDHNTAEAKRIIELILSKSKMPVLYLMLAEICEWDGNERGKLKWSKYFLDEVGQSAYGGMYNQYIIELLAESEETSAMAVSIAEEEVLNRATPETYSLLAWAYFKTGNREKACEIGMNRVYRRTFEPAALLKCALIFEECGKKRIAKILYKELQESGFELGPVQAELINERLNGRP